MTTASKEARETRMACVAMPRATSSANSALAPCGANDRGVIWLRVRCAKSPGTTTTRMMRIVERSKLNDPPPNHSLLTGVLPLVVQLVAGRRLILTDLLRHEWVGRAGNSAKRIQRFRKITVPNIANESGNRIVGTYIDFLFAFHSITPGSVYDFFHSFHSKPSFALPLGNNPT